MKRVLAVALMIVSMITMVNVSTKAEEYNLPVVYAIPILADIADDYSTLETDLQKFAYCEYNDISKVYTYTDEECPFEQAFRIPKFQVPTEGIIYAIGIKDQQYIALADSYGTVISVQNINKTQEQAKFLSSLVKTFDFNKLSKEDFNTYKTLTYDMLYQSLTLGMIWFDASMYADGNQSSKVKNVWH